MLTCDCAQDLEKSKEKLQKELTVVKSEYSLLKDKLLQETTALKEELHVAKVNFTKSRFHVICLC